MSKNLAVSNNVQENLAFPSIHHLMIGDSRDMTFLNDNSVHLILTSPPYWNLKHYPDRDTQLGNINDYEAVNGVYAQFFKAHKPARSTAAVKGLPKGLLIEIEAIAVRIKSKKSPPEAGSPLATKMRGKK